MSTVSTVSSYSAVLPPSLITFLVIFYSFFLLFFSSFHLLSPPARKRLMLFFCCCCFFYLVSNWSEPSILQRYLSCPPPPHFLALVRCKETTPLGLGLVEVQTWKLCGMLTLKTFWLRPRLHKCTVCQLWLSQTVLFKVQSAGLFAKMMASAIWNCTLKGCTMHTWSGGSGSPVSVLDNTSQSAPKSHWTSNNNFFSGRSYPIY